MRFVRSLFAAILVLGAVSACQPYKLQEAFLSRDQEGLRPTDCFRPEWQTIWLNARVLNFKKTTKFIPVITALETEPGAPGLYMGDEELQKYKNDIPAAGSETEIMIEIGPPAPAEASDPPPLPIGRYRIDLYLDDDEFVEAGDAPVATLPFKVSAECPCRPFPKECEKAGTSTQ